MLFNYDMPEKKALGDNREVFIDVDGELVVSDGCRAFCVTPCGTVFPMTQDEVNEARTGAKHVFIPGETLSITF